MASTKPFFEEYTSIKQTTMLYQSMLQFLKNNNSIIPWVSWLCQKQACVTISTVEAEYIFVGSCCAQVLWLKQQLSDYILNLGCIYI